MVSLVSLDRVKMALRIGETGTSPIPAHDDDALLEEVYIPAASTAVINYLKDQAETVIPSLADSPPTGDDCPEGVQVAVIDIVRVFYDGTTDEQWQRIMQGYLPPVATVMLHPLRDPALA